MARGSATGLGQPTFRARLPEAPARDRHATVGGHGSRQARAHDYRSSRFPPTGLRGAGAPVALHISRPGFAMIETVVDALRLRP
ncbi:hypothetical protein AB0D42_28730 [Streptomyces sp. NPDC048304]|uniref:hypothetical protein n=1 Tax=Streptomyces sp. NPDC048304 TaxID=3154820 RepID=UPI0034060F2A